jgi:3-oxoacyl-[acyl-carrier protein] reductase/bacilysin biosynthesis oxidoreductase BacG
MKSELRGKLAMVSGAGQGIGLAIAELLAQEGADVSICSRNADVLGQVASRIQNEYAIQCLPVAADLTTSEGIEAWKAATMAKFGRVDILVNNASATKGGSFLDLTPEIWQQALALKMHGYINVARAMLPIMQSQKSGSVVNIIGVTGSQPVPGGMIGAVAGAALINFTKALALEVAHWGIRVNAVSPGATETHRRVALLESLRRSGMNESDAQQASVRDIPLGRAASPREIANVAVFVASELASYMTGENINVDGGYVRGI